MTREILSFMTHFSNDDIPLVWHQVNEIHRMKTLHYFLGNTPQWHAFAQTQAYNNFT
jgi:hypothetical protein